MSNDVKVAIQVAAEAVVDDPDAFFPETRKAVLRAATEAETPEYIVNMLKEVIEQ